MRSSLFVVSVFFASIPVLDALPRRARAGSAGALPELRFRIESSGHPQPLCFTESDEVLVAVELGPAPVVINGAQFVVLYDPACLRFNYAAPAGDPYVLQLIEQVNPSTGTIVYAVGVQLGGMGGMGDTDLAVLSFTRLGDCNPCSLCFGGANPVHTYLTDAQGQAVLVDTACSDPISAGGLPRLTVPSSATVEAECNGRAMVTWSEPEASAPCGVIDDHAEGRHVESDIAYDVDTALHGGLLSIGTSEFCYSASSACGAVEQACWTIVVLPPPAVATAAGEPDKNRYLSFQAGSSTEPVGYRVTLLYANGYPESEGRTYWVGPPSSMPDVAAGETFLAAPLQCAQHFSAWPAGAIVHVHGPAILPGGGYAIQSVKPGCATGPSSSLANATLLYTSDWADVTAPFTGPDFADVTAIVGAFQQKPGAVHKRRAQLQPDAPDPSASISFADVSVGVKAVQGSACPFPAPPECP